MGSYRLDVPLSEQTKNYFFISKAFLESIGYGNKNLFFLVYNALSLFQGYLDLLKDGSFVLGHSQRTNALENAFNLQEVSEEMCKEPVLIMPIAIVTQDAFDLVENVRIKSLAQTHSEAIVYAISYFAFLVEILEQGGNVVLGMKTDYGFRINLYDIELFRSYHSDLISVQ